MGGKQSGMITAANRVRMANDNDRRARISNDSGMMRQAANVRDTSPSSQPPYNQGMSNDANMYGASRRIQVQPPGVPLHHRHQPLASGQPRANSATRRKYSPSPGAPVAT